MKGFRETQADHLLGALVKPFGQPLGTGTVSRSVGQSARSGMCNENRRAPVQSPVRERHASRPINPPHTLSPLLAFQGLDVPLRLFCRLVLLLLPSVLPIVV